MPQRSTENAWHNQMKLNFSKPIEALKFSQRSCKGKFCSFISAFNFSILPYCPYKRLSKRYPFSCCLHKIISIFKENFTNLQKKD